MVNGLPYLEVDGEICKGCILGKQNRERFSNRAWKDRECIALVHSYLCGPSGDFVFWKGKVFPNFY
jgi:hypothetical protein